MRYLLDIDILIEVLRNNSLVFDQVWQIRLGGHVLCYSPITRAELYTGLRPGEEIPTAQLLARLTCIAVDDAKGEKAGHYMKSYCASHGLALADALIAASPTEEDAALVTFNSKHYPMPDLRLHHLRRAL